AFQIAYAFWIDERYELLLPDQQPKNEIRIEVPRLEEADASPADVAKQVKLPLFEEVLVAVEEGPQVEHEVALPFVERHRTDLDKIALEVQKRLVQVLAEPHGFEVAPFPALERPVLEHLLQFSEVLDDGVRRLLDQ